jgi:uncharacterized membrane protein
MFPKQMHRSEYEDPGPAIALVPGAVTAGTLLVAFTLLAVGFEEFWVAFPVGFGVVLPTAMGVLKSSRAQGTKSGAGADRKSGNDALATLRERYARGEITDAEFEDRVERLLETETRPETHGSAGE